MSRRIWLPLNGSSHVEYMTVKLEALRGCWEKFSHVLVMEQLICIIQMMPVLLILLTSPWLKSSHKRFSLSTIIKLFLYHCCMKGNEALLKKRSIIEFAYSLFSDTDRFKQDNIISLAIKHTCCSIFCSRIPIAWKEWLVDNIINSFSPVFLKRKQWIDISK